jgi:hypothetical protein
MRYTGLMCVRQLRLVEGAAQAQKVIFAATCMMRGFCAVVMIAKVVELASAVKGY